MLLFYFVFKDIKVMVLVLIPIVSFVISFLCNFHYNIHLSGAKSVKDKLSKAPREENIHWLCSKHLVSCGSPENCQTVCNSLAISRKKYLIRNQLMRLYRISGSFGSLLYRLFRRGTGLDNRGAVLQYVLNCVINSSDDLHM